MTNCPTCNGEGTMEHPFLQGAYGGSHAECPPDPVFVECEDCAGTGMTPTLPARLTEGEVA